MNGFLVPANAKRGTLIFNVFRPFDLILFITGCSISLLLLSIGSATDILVVAIKMLPGGICGLLVVPLPNYHNVLCALQSMYIFYSERRKYVWKGWCFNEQFRQYEAKSKRKK